MLLLLAPALALAAAPSAGRHPGGGPLRGGHRGHLRPHRPGDRRPLGLVAAARGLADGGDHRDEPRHRDQHPGRFGWSAGPADLQPPGKDARAEAGEARASAGGAAHLLRGVPLPAADPHREGRARGRPGRGTDAAGPVLDEPVRGGRGQPVRRLPPPDAARGRARALPPRRAGQEGGLPGRAGHALALDLRPGRPQPGGCGDDAQARRVLDRGRGDPEGAHQRDAHGGRCPVPRLSAPATRAVPGEVRPEGDRPGRGGHHHRVPLRRPARAPGLAAAEPQGEAAPAGSAPRVPAQRGGLLDASAPT